MTDVTDQLRAQVRAALKSSGITQVAAASQLGLSQKHLSQMLTGRVALTFPWAERVLELCGMRLVIALEFTPTHTPGATR